MGAFKHAYTSDYVPKWLRDSPPRRFRSTSTTTSGSGTSTSTNSATNASKGTKAKELTQEQRQRIEENKKRALEIRKRKSTQKSSVASITELLAKNSNSKGSKVHIPTKWLNE